MTRVVGPRGCRDGKPSCGHAGKIEAKGLCKHCYTKQWQAAHPEKKQQYYRSHREELLAHSRAYKRRIRYGLSDSEWVELQKVKQCALCRTEGKRLVIDHDHNTGAVRGMLCDTCNYMLGHVEQLDVPADELAKRIEEYVYARD